MQTREVWEAGGIHRDMDDLQAEDAPSDPFIAEPVDTEATGKDLDM